MRDGTSIPHLDVQLPCTIGVSWGEDEEPIVAQVNIPVRLTNPADIFDEMTKRGCRLNLVTFGYYMEEG